MFFLIFQIGNKSQKELNRKGEEEKIVEEEEENIVEEWFWPRSCVISEMKKCKDYFELVSRYKG